MRRHSYRLVIPDQARVVDAGQVSALIARLFRTSPEGTFWRDELSETTVVVLVVDAPSPQAAEVSRVVAELVLEVDRLCPGWRASARQPVPRPEPAGR